MAHVGTPIVVNPLNKVWRGWPQKEHPAEQPLVRSLLALCPVDPGGMLHTFLLGLWQLARLLLLVQLLGTSVLLLDVARLNMGFVVPYCG